MSEILQVVPLDIGDGAYDPRSTYVEQYWLPVLGPTATWLLRRIADNFDRAPSGFELDLAETAKALGLAQRGKVQGACQRLVVFSIARQQDLVLAVRRAVPALPRRYAHRLPTKLAVAHLSRKDADG